MVVTTTSKISTDIGFKNKYTTKTTTETPVWSNDDYSSIENSDVNFNYEDSFEVIIPNTLHDKLTNLEIIQELKQFPVNPTTMVVDRSPCKCDKGLCACCTGFILSVVNSKACMNLKYIPEDFAFEARMMVNNYEVYKTRLSGIDKYIVISIKL